MRRIWGVAASSAVLLGIAGCGSTSSKSAAETVAGSSGTPAATASASATASAAPVPTAMTSADAASLVLRLAVPAQQLGAGWTSQTITDGDVVQGQVTLDLCGASFASEALRLARHQIMLAPAGAGSDTSSDLSNEVVVYSGTGAQQAHDELVSAIATCPAGPVQGSVQGEGMLTYKVAPLAADPRWLPGTVAESVTATASNGQSMSEVTIYQFRGDALSAIYGPSTNGKADATELAAAADAAGLLTSLVPASS